MAKKYEVQNVLTKEYLEEEFIRKRRTQRDIARQHNCSEGHLSNILRDFGLRRPKSHRFMGDGQKYGSFTPLETAGQDEHGHTLVLAKCDCGSVSTELLCNLTTGNKTSCGCKRRATGVDNPGFRGFGEIPYRLWKSWMLGAEERGLSFEITMEYAWGLFLEQDRRCALTGEELVFASRLGDQKETTASLDRIRSGEGYAEGNVRWVTKFINMLRCNFSDEKLVYWAGKIADFHGDKKESTPVADRVFIAGPTRDGDLENNLTEADRVYVRLLQCGFAPYAPQRGTLCKTAACVHGVTLSAARQSTPGVTSRQWAANENAWLAACQFVIRLRGPSEEADAWVEFANARGIKVFHSVDELLAFRSADRVRARYEKD
jgi:hypothetical protein